MDTNPSPVTAVQFYWRPGCPYCVALRTRLRTHRIPIEPVNIWADPDAAARVRAVAGGNETVPTVFVGQRGLVNPSVGQVQAALREIAPDLLAGRVPRKRWFGRG